jgi:hypothetical protein
MKKFSTEIKWGIIFMVFTLLWMAMERALGWHDVHIDKHAVYTNLFAIPAIILTALTLLDKRKNYFDGKMTWKQGFLTGLGLTVVIALLSPLSMWITNTLITPHYFENVIAYSVEQGKLSQLDAEKYFSMSSYIMQSVIGATVMGLITSAIVAIFTKKK